jgi:hypothetical protein
MAIGSNPYAPPSESADGSPTLRREVDAGVDIAAFVVELRGRLAAADLAVLFRVTEDLQVRPALRQVLGWLLFVLLLASAAGVAIGGPPVEPGAVVVFLLLLTVLADLLALRHVRYRIMGRLLEGRTREHVARFDRHGLVLTPVDQLGASSSFDWPTVDVVTLREGLVITPRRGARVICFVPERHLTDDARQQVETLAGALGGRVLARAHGEPLS